MKKRKYAIIVEEGSNQLVYEIANTQDAIEEILPYTWGLFNHEDDELPNDCLESKNFRGLEEYLLWLNKEKLHPIIQLYVEAYRRLYRGVKRLTKLRKVLNVFNQVLEWVESDTRIYLNSRVDDGTISFQPLDIVSSVKSISTNLTKEEALQKAKEFLPGKVAVERFENKKCYVFTMIDEQEEITVGIDKKTGIAFDYSKD